MPRGRKKKLKFKPNIKPDTLKSILSLGLILFSLISFISFLAPDYFINEKIQQFWRGLFGFPSIIAVFLVGSAGLMLIDAFEYKIKEPRIIFGLIMLLFTLTGLFHIFLPDNEGYEMAQDGLGGGLIGYKLASGLVGALSFWGGLLTLLILLLVSFVVIFDVSVDSILQRFNLVGDKKKESVKDSDSASDGEPSKGLLGGILSKLNKKSKSSLEMEVSSGALLSDEMSAALHETNHKSHVQPAEDIEPIIEVIPSMSEPQEGITPIDLGKTRSSSSGVPTLPYADRVWQNPPSDLLLDQDERPIEAGDVDARAKKIKDTLKSFSVDIEIVDIKSGPSVTQYALKAESGIKVSKIAGLQNDLALALASPTGSVRIEAPIPGKALIGIEVPNDTRALVNFKPLLQSEPMKYLKSKLGIVLGKDVGGRVFAYDIGKMPHMLIAGTTGSGKSVFVHNILFSILYRSSPQEVRFILVDPKRVELTHYQDIPHLLTPVVTDMDKAPSVFKWAVAEMERRYKLFETARARNIESYNEKSGFQALPYIVMIVDELAEIMVIDPAGVEKSIIRLAQLARATGIHLVLAVQRPSTNIITGLIKANIPCRIAFNVASQVDSRVIIDQPGAEKLLGKGDMLFVPPDNAKPMRLQAAFIDDREISNLVTYLKNQGVQPDYKEDILEMAPNHGKSKDSSWGDDVDDLFEQAVEIVVVTKKASASLLQRKLSIGYARAARIIDELEAKGIIGAADGSKPRDVLIDNVPGGSSLPDLNKFDYEDIDPGEPDTINSIQ